MRSALTLLVLLFLAPASRADVFSASLDFNVDYIEIGTVVTGTETIDTVNGAVDAVNLVFHLNGVNYAINTPEVTFDVLTFPNTGSPNETNAIFEQTVSTPELTGQLAFDLNQTGSLVGLTIAEFCNGVDCQHSIPNGNFSLTDYLQLRAEPQPVYLNNFGLLLNASATPVPEPSTLTLLATGIAVGLTLLIWRSHSQEKRAF